MATEKKAFVLYHDIRTPLELLTDEQRGRLFTAILDYSEFGSLPEFDGALMMAFAFIRMSLDRDAATWAEKRTKRVEAGRNGGLAKAANASIARQNEQSQANLAVLAPAPVNVNVPAPVNSMTASPPARAKSDGFDRFWEAYPKKVGKEAARKAFKQVKAPLESLLTAIERQKCGDQWTTENGRFIPNPVTWLNQERWQDEVSPPAAAKPGQNVQRHDAPLSDIEREAVARMLGNYLPT